MKLKVQTFFDSCKRVIQANRKLLFALAGRAVYRIIIFIVEKIIDRLF